MFNLQVTSTTMELLPLVCLCLLTRSGTTFADEGSKVINVEEDSDVTLPCSLSTKEDIEFKLFDWKKDGQKEVFLYDAGIHYNNGGEGQDEQFKGRVSHFQDRLMHGDASIIIRNTKVTDSGDYTCDFPRLQPRQIFHIQLVVGRILKDIPGSSTGLVVAVSVVGAALCTLLVVGVVLAVLYKKGYKLYKRGSPTRPTPSNTTLLPDLNLT